MAIRYGKDLSLRATKGGGGTSEFYIHNITMVLSPSGLMSNSIIFNFINTDKTPLTSYGILVDYLYRAGFNTSTKLIKAAGIQTEGIVLGIFAGTLFFTALISNATGQYSLKQLNYDYLVYDNVETISGGISEGSRGFDGNFEGANSKFVLNQNFEVEAKNGIFMQNYDEIGNHRELVMGSGGLWLSSGGQTIFQNPDSLKACMLVMGAYTPEEGTIDLGVLNANNGRMSLIHIDEDYMSLNIANAGSLIIADSTLTLEMANVNIETTSFKSNGKRILTEDDKSSWWITAIDLPSGGYDITVPLNEIKTASHTSPKIGINDTIISETNSNYGFVYEVTSNSVKIVTAGKLGSKKKYTDTDFMPEISSDSASAILMHGYSFSNGIYGIDFKLKYLENDMMNETEIALQYFLDFSSSDMTKNELTFYSKSYDDNLTLRFMPTDVSITVALLYFHNTMRNVITQFEIIRVYEI